MRCADLIVDVYLPAASGGGTAGNGGASGEGVTDSNVQVSRFCKVLKLMAQRIGRQVLKDRGPLALAGVLNPDHIRGIRQLGIMEGAATVFSSDSATIQNGAVIVRTAAGSRSHARTKTDHFVYIPFMKRGKQWPCVMRIDQILLVNRPGMGWRDDEARIAVGTLFDKLSIGAGGGLEVDFNDDPTITACKVPRLLHATAAQLKQGYPWAVHLRQVYGPVVYLPGTTWSAFITFGKIGYHGSKDTL